MSEHVKPILMAYSSWRTDTHLDIIRDVADIEGWSTENYNQEKYALKDLMDAADRYTALVISLERNSIPPANSSRHYFNGKALIEAGQLVQIPRALITPQDSARRIFVNRQPEDLLLCTLSERTIRQKLSQWLVGLSVTEQ
jgi:hypothetical protein